MLLRSILLGFRHPILQPIPACLEIHRQMAGLLQRAANSYEQANKYRFASPHREIVYGCLSRCTFQRLLRQQAKCAKPLPPRP